MVTILAYTAIAGMVGAGGLGSIAIQYGHNRGIVSLMWVTVVFLIAMMIFMGVRKIPVLVFVPIGTTLFLSLAFRTFLHVLLP